MENYAAILKHSPLFEGIEDVELKPLLQCLMPSRRTIGKNEYVFLAGGSLQSVGIVLSGSVHVLQEDYWGNRTILAHIPPGGLFGEAFAWAELDCLPVSVIAVEKTEILMLDDKRMITTCSSACDFHAALIKNMLKLLANKNILLTQKMEILTRRTTRERLLAYLSTQAVKTGKNRFTIPFSRQQLADFLAVERSAMSAELSRMQADGLIRTKRSEFTLLAMNL